MTAASIAAVEPSEKVDAAATTTMEAVLMLRNDESVLRAVRNISNASRDEKPKKTTAFVELVRMKLKLPKSDVHTKTIAAERILSEMNKEWREVGF